MKKIIITLTLIISIVSLNTSFALAKNEKTDMPKSKYEIGTVIKTKATENPIEESTESDDPEVSTNYVAEYWWETREDSSVSLIECEFVKYLTASWAKTDKYVWQSSQQTTLSFSASLTSSEENAIVGQLGLSQSYTSSYGVGIEIPADPSRWSKLAFGSDYNEQDVSVRQVTKTGVWPFEEYYYFDWKSTTYKEPTEDTYLYVYYK